MEQNSLDQDSLSARPSWDQYFMELTAVVAKRSTCLRRKVGAILVRDKRVLATGYNGAPSGLEHCQEAGCIRESKEIPSGQRHELCRGLHAEQNAIIQAALHGISIDEAVLYSTHQPCILCTKMLINTGVKRIVFIGEYPDQLANNMLAEAGIEVQKMEDA
ncbi:deoxycytidylate deaminase [Fuchsiella alkaliacetigena]|uniref:deoxycytidylate deaminase n=1 Tax=Fuchsiella alkaliacetigena TaxID=957042 RepID=UPI00200B39E7|nr:cytidine/deoxycytidylate deaminase family protein [Fuchsiella alkaliacetigena]MCK8824591.1 cytidine/deoxycytidylate deaminase family protein [Fuchsiella alkaliacetigena]